MKISLRDCWMIMIKNRILIIGAAALLLVTGLSGCTNIEYTSSDREDTDDWGNSDDDSWNNWDIEDSNTGIEEFRINGNNIIRTIHYLGKPVSLWVNGNGCDVTVTKETDLIDVWLNGNNCIVRASKSHSFNPHINGNNCDIVYYD